MSNMAYAQSVSDMVLEIGRARAQGELGKAAAWTGAVQQIPRTLGSWAQARDNRKVEAENARVREMQMRGLERDEQRSLADWNDEQQIRALGPLVGNDPQAMAREVGVINPAKAAPFRQQANVEKTETERFINRWAGSILNLPEEKRPEAWGHLRTTLATAKPHAVSMLPEAYSEGFVRDLYTQTMNDDQFADSLKPKPTPQTETITINNPDGTQTIKMVEKKPGQEFTNTPPAAKVTFNPEIRIVDGQRSDVLLGSDGNWYFPGDTKKPIPAARVRPVQEKETGTKEDGITPSARAAAERWKFEQLDQLENRRLEFPERVSDADMYNAKLQIENAYRQQLQLQPLKSLPGAWGDVGRPMGTSTAPPAPPAPAPVAAPAAAPRPSTAPTLGANATQTVIQNGITYDVTTDAAGNVIRAAPAATASSAPVATQHRAAAAATAHPPSPAPAAAAPSRGPMLPAGTGVGDTLTHDGTRYRVSAVQGTNVSLAPVTDAPRAGDIVIYDGVRYRIAAIKDGQATLAPAE